MSDRQRTQQVLEALELSDVFGVVATSDDVERGKPDPQIYYLVCEELGIPHRQTLAIEDSPAGVEAALAAALHCIAVTTPFTRREIHDQSLLEGRWIVDHPDRLPVVARTMIEAST
jgi:beta-phosphoglucomutase-like phosphatase (HAD superfamily)